MYAQPDSPVLFVLCSEETRDRISEEARETIKTIAEATEARKRSSSSQASWESKKNRPNPIVSAQSYVLAHKRQELELLEILVDMRGIPGLEEATKEVEKHIVYCRSDLVFAYARLRHLEEIMPPNDGYLAAFRRWAADILWGRGSIRAKRIKAAH